MFNQKKPLLEVNMGNEKLGRRRRVVNKGGLQQPPKKKQATQSIATLQGRSVSSPAQPMNENLSFNPSQYLPKGNYPPPSNNTFLSDITEESIPSPSSPIDFADCDFSNIFSSENSMPPPQASTNIGSRNQSFQSILDDYDKGKVLLKSGKLSEAYDIYAELIQNFSSMKLEFKGELLMEFSVICLKLGKFELAIKHLEFILEKYWYSDGTKIRVVLIITGLTYVRWRQSNTSEFLSKNSPYYFSSLLLQGIYFLYTNNDASTERACDCLRETLDSYPYNRNANLLMGICLYRKKDYIKALKHLRYARRALSCPEKAKLSIEYWMGMCHLKLENFCSAFYCFSGILIHNPNHKNA